MCDSDSTRTWASPRRIEGKTSVGSGRYVFTVGRSSVIEHDCSRASKQVAKLFADSSTIAIASFISPYRADRGLARDMHRDDADKKAGEPLEFIEVHVDISVEEAEKRDPKGLYKKARAGEIKEFTGISAPYEEPENPEIYIKSDKMSVEESVAEIMKYLAGKKLIDVKV